MATTVAPCLSTKDIGGFHCQGFIPEGIAAESVIVSMFVRHDGLASGSVIGAASVRDEDII
jgi:hypothetical protein